MQQIAEKHFTIVQSSEQQRIAELEIKAREMEESIRYAGNLQQSILPNEQLFRNAFDDAFVFFQPKELVGGDFYWITQNEDDIYFAVGDCTGHGVPGAMVNIAGNTLLKQIIRNRGCKDPGEIISQLDQELVALFNDNLTKGQTYDGMDIVFCRFNLKTQVGSYCGAGRPLLLVRNGDLIEFKKGLSSVGYNIFGAKEFITIDFDLMAGDTFYLFSDGYTDQFGGENIKKFNRRRFRSLLSSLAGMDMKQQKKELQLSLQNWMGQHDQIDDVCVLGVRI